MDYFSIIMFGNTPSALSNWKKYQLSCQKSWEKEKNISFFREFEFQAPDSSLPKARRAIFNETYQMILLLILAIFIEFWKLSINVHSYSREPFRNLQNSINLIS